MSCMYFYVILGRFISEGHEGGDREGCGPDAANDNQVAREESKNCEACLGDRR
jgi:hypothetical protein